MTIGVGGSGKTGHAFMAVQLILEGDTYICKWDDEDTKEHHERERYVALFRTPNSLVDEIKRSMKECGYDQWVGKFRVIHHLWEVMNNDIVVIDEGVLNANGKEALKKEFVDFEKALSYSRHKRLICLLNATDDGFLLSFRKMAHVTFYKMVGKGFIDYCKDDKFVQKVGYKLTKLKVQETVVFSTYKVFSEIGKIVLDLKEICPWYNDKISQSLAGKSFSSLFEERKEVIDRVYEWGRLISEKFKKRLDERSVQRVITGWFIKEDFRAYFELKKYLQEIFAVAYYEHDQIKQTDKTTDEELETGGISQKLDTMVLRETGFEFDRVAYLEENYVKTEKIGKHSYRDFFIWKMRKDGIEANPIIEKAKEKFGGNTLSRVRVSQIERDVDRVMGDIDRIMGKAYEVYFERKLNTALKDTGASVEGRSKGNGARGKPDCVVFYPDNRITVYSLKCFGLEDDTIYIKPKEYQVEIDYCKALRETTEYAKVKLVLHLYYMHTKTVHEREIVDLDHPKEHERFDVGGMKKKKIKKEKTCLTPVEMPTNPTILEGESEK